MATTSQHKSLRSMLQDLRLINVKPPVYENDVKERLKELFFGFGRYQERPEATCYDGLAFETCAYVPKWMWGMLGLADTDESHAYARNPSLKRVAGDFLIAPNPFYFDYSKYTDRPWEITSLEPTGFRLCIYWVHPVLQELSPYFSTKQPNYIRAYQQKHSGPAASSYLYKLCQAAMETPERMNETYFGSLRMYDATPTVSVREIQALCSNQIKYLYTWQDCDATHIAKLEQLKLDTQDYLRSIFRMNGCDNDTRMCFHTTTAVRNPLLKTGSQRSQYLHLHLQVYCNGYVPSLSCRQRSIGLDELIFRLRTEAGPLCPSTRVFYDETLLSPSADEDTELRSILTTSKRFFAEDALVESGSAVRETFEATASLDMALASYYGMTQSYFSRDWPIADAIKLVRNSFTSFRSQLEFPSGWSLDQRRRTVDSSPRIIFMIGCKGAGKTTHGRQFSECHPSFLWIDGASLKYWESGYFASCTSTDRFQFKIALVKWAVRHGLDLIMSTSNAHGTVEEVKSFVTAELAYSHHDLEYKIEIHIVAAPWKTCWDRVVTRDRRGDVGPATRELHKRGYLRVLQTLRNMGTSRNSSTDSRVHLSKLKMIDNTKTDRFHTETEMIDCQWNTPECLIQTYRDFLHSTLGDPFQFEHDTFDYQPSRESSYHRENASRTLVIIRGPPGVGKTTLWKRILMTAIPAIQPPSHLARGPWYVIDGEIYSEQYRTFWEMRANDETICSHGARHSRDQWKAWGRTQAWDQKANLMVPLTDDTVQCAALQNRALELGYSIQVWIILADFKVVVERLEQRHQRSGTPTMGSMKSFYDCYHTITDQHQTPNALTEVWTLDSETGQWSRSMAKVKKFLDHSETVEM